MPKRVYSSEQISAARALAAMRPRPRLQDIAAITGISFNTVRFYAAGRDKSPPTEPWAGDIISAIGARMANNPVLAAYHLVSAAKHLLKQRQL